MAIEKGNDRRVTGEDAAKAIAMGLSKMLKEQVEPSSVSVSECEDGIQIDCTATPMPKKTRAKKAS